MFFFLFSVLFFQNKTGGLGGGKGGGPFFPLGFSKKRNFCCANGNLAVKIFFDRSFPFQGGSKKKQNGGRLLTFGARGEGLGGKISRGRPRGGGTKFRAGGQKKKPPQILFLNGPKTGWAGDHPALV